MFYERRLAALTLRKEGLASVMNRTWRYMIKWPRYGFFTLKVRHFSLDRNSELLEVVNVAFGA